MHLLITYDLKAPGKDYAPLINMIKTIGSALGRTSKIPFGM